MDHKDNYVGQQINNDDDSSQARPSNQVNDNESASTNNDDFYKQFFVNSTSNQTDASAQRMANSPRQRTSHYSGQSINKSKKDESHVKRPMNAFMVWSKETRKEIAKANPKMHNSEISKRLGKTWKAMSPDSKEKYVKEAKILRKKHMEENPDYKYKPKRKNRSLKGAKIFNQNTSTNDPHSELINQEFHVSAPPFEYFSHTHNAYPTAAQMHEHWEQMNSEYLHNPRGFPSNEKAAFGTNMPHHFGAFQSHYPPNGHLGTTSFQNTIQNFHPGYKLQHNIQPSTNSECCDVKHFSPVSNSSSSGRHPSGSEGVLSASTSPEIELFQMPDYQQNQQMQYDVQSMQVRQTYSDHPNNSGSCSVAASLHSFKNASPVNILTQTQCSESTYLQQTNPMQPIGGVQTSSHQPNYSGPSTLLSSANLNQENVFIPHPSSGSPYEHQQHTQSMHHMCMVETSNSRQPVHYGQYDQTSLSPACQDRTASIHPTRFEDFHNCENFTSNNISPNSNSQY